MMSWFKPPYEKVPAEHDGCHNGADEGDGSRVNNVQLGLTNNTNISWAKILPWCLHLLLMIFYSALLLRPVASSGVCSPCFSGKSRLPKRLRAEFTANPRSRKASWGPNHLGRE